jgi:hypothetical protein
MMIEQKWLKNLSDEEQVALLKARHEHRVEQAREAARRNKLKNLARKYNTSEDELQAMLDAAQGRCAICRREFGDKPNFDHCHRTMKVRGILCASCNHGISRFEDEPDLLRKAIAYLESYSRSFA